jgi:hypothetical protein
MGQPKCAAGEASKLLQHRDKKSLCGEGRVNERKRKRENREEHELWVHLSSWVVPENPADLTEPTVKTEFLHSGSCNEMAGRVLEVMCAVPHKNLGLTITRVGVLNGTEMKGSIPNGEGKRPYSRRTSRSSRRPHCAFLSEGAAHFSFLSETAHDTGVGMFRRRAPRAAYGMPTLPHRP